MEPLAAAYRVSSSSVALGALVLGNLIPLAGVLFAGWDLQTILVLYWLENGIVGAYNIPKILLAQGDASPVGSPVGRLGTVAFFMVHYGGFWAVHGVFVWFALPAFAAAATGGLADPDPTAVLLGGIGLALSHGVSFVLNYLGRGEFRTATVARQMFVPYGRVFVLHVTIVGGAFAGMFLGTTLGSLVILVVIKTAIDAGFHLREHRTT